MTEQTERDLARLRFYEEHLARLNARPRSGRTEYRCWLEGEIKDIRSRLANKGDAPTQAAGGEL